MKYSKIIFAFSTCMLLFSGSLLAQQTEEIKYNEALAKELGADDYGMKSYVMALLKSGPNKSPTTDSAKVLQAAHMANITSLAEEGYLVMAGPFLDNGDLRGIYIFAVSDVEEAKRLTETDPAIKAGTLVMELHPWYGSAAIMKMNELHESIQKIRF